MRGAVMATITLVALGFFAGMGLFHAVAFIRLVCGG